MSVSTLPLPSAAPALSAPPSGARRPLFNLTAALAIIGLADLFFHRALGRLLLPNALLSAAGNRAVMGAATFLSHLAGALGLCVLGAALAARGHRRQLFPRAIQISLLFIGAVFLLFAARGVLAPGDDRFGLHLKISHGFLVLFVLLGLSHSAETPAPPRAARLGVALFALPTLLQTAVAFSERLGGGHAATWIPRLNHAGEVLALSAAVLAPWLLARGARRGLAGGIALLAGALAVTGFTAAMVFRFDWLQAVALYGARIELSPPVTTTNRIFAGLFALGCSGITVTVVATFLRGGSARLISYGTLLCVAAGNQASAPAELTLSLCGFLALALGVRELPSVNNGETGATAATAGGDQQNDGNGGRMQDGERDA